MRIHPAQRRLVGIVVGIVKAPARDDLPALTEARVAVYADRHAAEPLTHLQVGWPTAGAFRPTLGDRLAVTLEPVE